MVLTDHLTCSLYYHTTEFDTSRVISLPSSYQVRYYFSTTDRCTIYISEVKPILPEAIPARNSIRYEGRYQSQWNVCLESFLLGVQGGRVDLKQRTYRETIWSVHQFNETIQGASSSLAVLQVYLLAQTLNSIKTPLVHFIYLQYRHSAQMHWLSIRHQWWIQEFSQIKVLPTCVLVNFSKKNARKRKQ